MMFIAVQALLDAGLKENSFRLAFLYEVNTWQKMKKYIVATAEEVEPSDPAVGLGPVLFHGVLQERCLRAALYEWTYTEK